MTRTMLIVDDEETIRWALRELFMQDGWQVHCAADGHEAARMMAGVTYDYMITDLKMAGPTGVELIEQARRRNPQMGVTVLTGYPSVETAVEALRLQAWDYVTKPCKAVGLKRRVDGFFQQARLGRGRPPLQEADAAAFLDGAGVDILPVSPLRSPEQNQAVFARLREAFAHLGLGEQRQAELLQSCVEAAAAVSAGDGQSRGRAALLKGHVVVGLTASTCAGALPAGVAHALGERFNVRAHVVRGDQACSIVLSEAI